MTNIARRLASIDYILRSGGAKGADQAFEAGAEHKQIFYTDKFIFGEEYSYTPESWYKAELLASVTHPNWAACSEFARMSHTRNVFQVHGPTLEQPSELLICYAEAADIDDARTYKGGTRTAAMIANRAGIPVHNLFFPEVHATWQEWLPTE